MKRRLQQVFVFLVVASMASWSQAEICPMKLQSQKADACSSSMAMPQHHAHAASAAHQHDCCPTGRQSKSTEAQCPDHQLSACISAMACCSLDIPASTTSQTHSLPSPVAYLHENAMFPVPVRTARIIVNCTVPSESSVFRLKEDLRV